MRHQKHGRKFGRKSAARNALFSNLVASLIEHERIQTTDAKAKELRRIAERTITWATSVGNLVSQKDKNDAADKARVVHAMRMAQRVVRQRPALEKLFSDLGPRFVGRTGGYTRVLKLKHRHGDAAPISIIEFVDRASEKAAAAPEPQKAETKKRRAATTAGAAAPKKAAGGAKASPQKAAAEKKATEPRAKKKAPKKAAAKKDE